MVCSTAHTIEAASRFERGQTDAALSRAQRRGTITVDRVNNDRGTLYDVVSDDTRDILGALDRHELDLLCAAVEKMNQHGIAYELELSDRYGLFNANVHLLDETDDEACRIVEAERQLRRLLARAVCQIGERRNGIDTPELHLDRCVVALDVDGVINVLGNRSDMMLATIDVHIDAGTVLSPFVRAGGLEELDVTVRYDPTIIRWIHQLCRRADVVWATTWEHAANIVLAPALGLPELPVAVSVDENPPTFSQVKNGDSAWWKAESLSEKYPGRPLVWTDDNAYSYTTSPWRHSSEDEHTLVIACDPREGLTVEQRRQIDEFANRYRQD